MIPYYLREIPGNKFNSSQETPIFWHHANPDINLFAFMYGLGGIINGREALNILSGICQQIEQRTDFEKRRESLLQELVNDAEERLLIGGGRRDKPQGLNAMLDLFWLGTEGQGCFVKAGTGKVYLLQDEGKVFPLGGSYILGAGSGAFIKTQDFSESRGILLAPPDISRRVTEEEIRKIFGKTSGRHPREKLADLEKKIAEPELALLERYTQEELVGMLRQYGKDSFIPEEPKMLAGVVAAIAGETPELQKQILSELGVGHISLMYLDLENKDGRIIVGLQAELTESSRKMLDMEGERALAQTELMLAGETIREDKRREDTLVRKATMQGELLTKVYLALNLEDVENPDEVVLTAIVHACEREQELELRLFEAEGKRQETIQNLKSISDELRDVLVRHSALEDRHHRLAGDYASLQRHNGAIRERYEAMLAAGRQEKEQAEQEVRDGREYSAALEKRVSEMCRVVEELASAIGIPEFDEQKVAGGLVGAAHKQLGEERQRYARLVGVVREETALKEDCQRTAVKLEETLRRSKKGTEEIRIETEREKEGLRAVLADLAGREERLRGEFSSLQERHSQMQFMGAAFDELVGEADKRGTKIAELLADYDALKENWGKLQGQVEEAAHQIISVRQESGGYQRRAEAAEERLRSLTEDALRQGKEEAAQLHAELKEGNLAGKPGMAEEKPLRIEFSPESLARITAIVEKHRSRK